MQSGQCNPRINITIVKFLGSSLNKLNSPWYTVGNTKFGAFLVGFII